jgi:hypothetical protein
MTSPAFAAAAAPAHTEPVRDVVARIEAELEAIAHAIDTNHARVAVAVGRDGTPSPAFVQAMQEGDLLYQKIAGIAGFMRALVHEMPADWTIDTASATRALGLVELARKIGAHGHAPHGHDEVDYGHCDLF